LETSRSSQGQAIKPIQTNLYDLFVNEINSSSLHRTSDKESYTSAEIDQIECGTEKIVSDAFLSSTIGKTTLNRIDSGAYSEFDDDDDKWVEQVVIDYLKLNDNRPSSRRQYVQYLTRCGFESPTMGIYNQFVEEVEYFIGLTINANREVKLARESNILVYQTNDTSDSRGVVRGVSVCDPRKHTELDNRFRERAILPTLPLPEVQVPETTQFQCSDVCSVPVKAIHPHNVRATTKYKVIYANEDSECDNSGSDDEICGRTPRNGCGAVNTLKGVYDNCSVMCENSERKQCDNDKNDNDLTDPGQQCRRSGIVSQKYNNNSSYFSLDDLGSVVYAQSSHDMPDDVRDKLMYVLRLYGNDGPYPHGMSKYDLCILNVIFEEYGVPKSFKTDMLKRIVAYDTSNDWPALGVSVNDVKSFVIDALEVTKLVMRAWGDTDGRPPHAELRNRMKSDVGLDKSIASKPGQVTTEGVTIQQPTHGAKPKMETMKPSIELTNSKKGIPSNVRDNDICPQKTVSRERQKKHNTFHGVDINHNMNSYGKVDVVPTMITNGYGNFRVAKDILGHPETQTTDYSFMHSSSVQPQSGRNDSLKERTTNLPLDDEFINGRMLYNKYFYGLQYEEKGKIKIQTVDWKSTITTLLFLLTPDSNGKYVHLAIFDHIAQLQCHFKKFYRMIVHPKWWEMTDYIVESACLTPIDGSDGNCNAEIAQRAAIYLIGHVMNPLPTYKGHGNEATYSLATLLSEYPVPNVKARRVGVYNSVVDKFNYTNVLVNLKLLKDLCALSDEVCACTYGVDTHSRFDFAWFLVAPWCGANVVDYLGRVFPNVLSDEQHRCAMFNEHYVLNVRERVKKFNVIEPNFNSWVNNIRFNNVCTKYNLSTVSRIAMGFFAFDTRYEYPTSLPAVGNIINIDEFIHKDRSNELDPTPFQLSLFMFVKENFDLSRVVGNAVVVKLKESSTFKGVVSTHCVFTTKYQFILLRTLSEDWVNDIAHNTMSQSIDGDVYVTLIGIINNYGNVSTHHPLITGVKTPRSMREFRQFVKSIEHRTDSPPAKPPTVKEGQAVNVDLVNESMKLIGVLYDGIDFNIDDYVVNSILYYRTHMRSVVNDKKLQQLKGYVCGINKDIDYQLVHSYIKQAAVTGALFIKDGVGKPVLSACAKNTLTDTLEIVNATNIMVPHSGVMAQNAPQQCVVGDITHVPKKRGEKCGLKKRDPRRSDGDWR
jgi:hypothetical protein